MIQRRDVVIGTAALAAAITTRADASPVRPRVRVLVFVMADDLGKDYGYNTAVMPNLGRMRAEGTDFPHTLSMPICVPTRATLLTGTYPCRHGWTSVSTEQPHEGWPTMASVGFPMWPQVLSAAGVRTHMFGKWQFRDARKGGPVAMRALGWSGRYIAWDRADPGDGNRYYGGQPLWTPDGPSTMWDAFSEDLFLEGIESALLDAAMHSEPVAIYYPMLLPHFPYIQPPGEPDDSRDSMVRRADHNLGAILDAVARFGLEGETIVIFTGDNGTAENGKGRVNLLGTNVPFVAWGPGLVPMGENSRQVVDFSDLAPTFCELFGTEMPAPIDGMSFAPALLGAGLGRRRTAISMSTRMLVERDGHLVPRDGQPSRRIAMGRRYWLDQHGTLRRRRGDARANAPRAAARMRAAVAALPPDDRTLSVAAA